MVLVMSVVIAIVIAAVTTYISTGLRYSRVVEEKADLLAAADGGLRYGIGKLSATQYPICLSAGTSEAMPVQVNGADVTVTCFEGDNGIGRIKAWAIIVTGEGVPPGQWMLQSSGAGGAEAKLLGGPVWITDPDASRTDLNADVLIDKGDVWFHRTNCNSYSLTIDPRMTFQPSYRGPICFNKPWNIVFPKPATGAIPTAPLNPVANTTDPGCRVFVPGKYTTMPILGNNNYFKSGNYYFENFTFDVRAAIITAGFAAQNGVDWGDSQFIGNAPCDAQIQADQNLGGPAGATFYLGGSAKIEVDNQGKLEIMRRLQADSLVSIQALNGVTAPYMNSNIGYNTNIIWTKSGANSDLAIHGLAWAPFAMMTFGNVTNDANGQLLGGAAFARISLQASASANAFLIRVESSPIAYELKVNATATKNGNSTTMTAIVHVDDNQLHAVNSFRVVQ